MSKLDYGGLIKADIERLNREAAWTDDQAAVFKLLLDDTLIDEGRMQRLKLSSSRYYRLKKEIWQKVERILRENQG